MLSTSSSGGSSLSQAWQSINQNLPALGPAASRVSSAKLRRKVKREATEVEKSLESLKVTLTSNPDGLLTAWITALPPTTFPRLRPHWQLNSYTSNETFFENNFGFSKQEVDLAHGPRSNSVLRGFLAPSSPLLAQVRGFKTRRTTSNTYGYNGSPFKKTVKAQSRALTDKFNEIKWPPEVYSKEWAEKVNKDYEEKIEEKEKEKAEKGQMPNNYWDWLVRAGSVSAIAVAIITVGVLMSGMMNNGVKVDVAVNETQPQEIEITFDDVRGCDEAKQELQEIVEFLMNPEKFSKLGGKLPKGCLLVGPPGTGKTLLARAVAGEAGVPFFHAAGPEFDEVLVGLGAKRIRELFKAAKAKAPCVIFIDEIDSVGSKRVNSSFSPYANQTINQLLTEMDGFISSEGVIVLGATNRADDLDKALTRPGRFDTMVEVPIPDLKGRKEILELYTSKTTHDNTIDLDVLARMTFGFSAADLENMVNTAAIRAAVEGVKAVTMKHFEYAHDKQTLGTDWKSRKREVDDLRITAYHEAGHTLVALFTENSIPLHKVTIASKGRSGGHTAFLPKTDSNFQTKAEILARMDTAMGGRAAEELIFGADKVTGGASSDLSSATSMAEAVVKKLGMSEQIGLRFIPDQSGASHMGPISNDLIDSEINRLLKDAYKRAMVILKSHQRELHDLAEALLERETLSAEEVKNIVRGKRLGPEGGNDLRVAGQAVPNSAKKPHTDDGNPGATAKSPVGRKGVLVFKNDSDCDCEEFEYHDE